MKILGVLTHSNRKGVKDFIHPVDWWRVKAPLEYLKKHTNWQIDIVKEWVDESKPLNDEFERLGQYDIIFTSYNIRQERAYAFMRALTNTWGVKHVMDFDDDIYNVSETNPASLQVYHRGNRVTKTFYIFDCIVRDVDYLTVTNNTLQKAYERVRKNKPKESITVLPNLVDMSAYKNTSTPVKDRLIIGYFGGVSHHGDLHNTGFLEAIKEIMTKYPHVDFYSVGMPIVNFKFPKNRSKFIEGANNGGEVWTKKLGGIHFDILTAPLEDTIFNKGKSPIKWMESTLLGAPVVASFVRPYIKAIEHGKTGFLAKSKEDWITYLSLLIENPELRKVLVNEASKIVKKDYSLENNWQIYKDYFESI